MSGELSLEGGQEPEEDGGGGKPRGQSERSRRRHRADIRDRFQTVFDRIADSLEGRGDAELAGMIREDSQAMVGGLVSVTKRVPAASGVILGGLAVLEPLIAFGRIFRLLLRRLGDRRAQAAYEAELEEPGYEQEPPPPAAPEVEEASPVARPWDLSGE